MRRRRYFFIAFIAAAVTFGMLTAFVNPRYSGMQRGCERGWHHDDNNRWNPHNDSEYGNDHQPQNLQHQ